MQKKVLALSYSSRMFSGDTGRGTPVWRQQPPTQVCIKSHSLSGDAANGGGRWQDPKTFWSHIKGLIFILILTIILFPASALADINDVYVIHFVIDGLNKKVFDAALDDNSLPTIKENLVDKGTLFTNATSLFPTTSTTIYQAYASGLLPGHSGIPHLERFDRQNGKVTGYLTISGYKKINSDFLNYKALENPNGSEINPPSTIFELLKDYPTATVYSSFSRGASVSYPRVAPFMALWSTYITNNKEHVDVLALNKVTKLFDGDIKDIPRYSIVGLYSADILGHGYGPEGAPVKDVLIQFDLFLSDFLKLLESKGIRDKTYIVVSSDHGMHKSGHLFKLQKALEAEGIVFKPGNPRIKKYEVYAANRGVASSQLYVRHKGKFEPINDYSILKKIPTLEGNVDLINLILGLEATDLLIIRNGEDKTRLFNSAGLSADIRCYNVFDNNWCSYLFDKTKGDPLGYSLNPKLAPLLDERPHHTREWLKATVDEKYPDAITQLSQIFHDTRAGDAFITTKDDFGFRKVKEGNHGGPTQDDMRVPMVIAGPTVPHLKAGTCRSTDIYPLIISWFGLKIDPANNDGINPISGVYDLNPDHAKIAELEALLDDKPPLIKMVGADDFVLNKFLKAISRKHLVALNKVVREENARRSTLLKNLGKLLKKLETQKLDDVAPKIVDEDYLDDYISVVNHLKLKTLQRVQRMDDILKITFAAEDKNWPITYSPFK